MLVSSVEPLSLGRLYERRASQAGRLVPLVEAV